MASPKHSTALFEVISSRRGHARGGWSRWFAGLFGARASQEVAVGAAPNATTFPSQMQVTPEAPPCAPAPASAAATKSPALDLDHDRAQVTLRMSYTSAIITLFAFATVIGAAFLAGRKMVTGPRPAFADSSTNQIRSGPAKSEVLNLEKKMVDVDPPPEADPPPPPGPNSEQSTQSSSPRTTTRTAGLNYVIIQGYPPAEEKMAQEAVKVLTENGIDCTVEKKLPRWGVPSWFVVVGLEGFDRIHNAPRYDAYMRKIREISGKYAKKNSFKAFEPAAYLWGKT